MSKVSFRTRQIDFNRPLSIVKYDSDLFYELGEGTFVNRGVLSVPSGMEREEENEHHFLEVLQALQLQKSSDISIPVPEIIRKSEDYEKIYPNDFTPTKHFIHLRTIALAEDEPVEYDMDSDDEEWLRRSDLNISPEKFENMIDRLERGCGQKVMNLEEARLLLKDDPSLVIAVYDYWLNKRVQCRQPLLLSVRQEKRDGGSNNDPYVAFRRRTERMQTRKNRKNDEYSYEKMLILREQMVTLGEIMSRMLKRESTKTASIEAERRIFQLRYKLGDWDAIHLTEADTVAQKSPKSFERIIGSRKHSRKRRLTHRSPDTTRGESSDGSEEERTLTAEEDIFAFIRIPGCKYQRPLEFRSAPEPDEQFLPFRLARVSNLSHGHRHSYTGYMRRRLGRGGRILLDRIPPPSVELQKYFQHLDTAPLPAEFHKIEARSWFPRNNYVRPLICDETVNNPSQQEPLSQGLQLSTLTSQSVNVLSPSLTKLSSRTRLPYSHQNAIAKTSNSNSIYRSEAISRPPSKVIVNSLSCLPIGKLLHPSITSPRSVPNITGITITTNAPISSPIMNPKGVALSASKVSAVTSTVNYPSHWVRIPALAAGTPTTRMVAIPKDLAPPSLEILTTTGLKIVTTGSEAFLKGHQNSNNSQGLKHSASSDQVQLTFSPGVNGGSKRDHDDFHWLPHITPTRKSSTAEEDVRKNKTKNGIMPVNPLHV